MNAEQFLDKGFGSDVEKIHKKHVIELMTNFAKHYHTEQCNIDNKKETSKNNETTQSSINAVNRRLSLADQEKLKKCKDSPVYFYNKYVRKDGQKELTEAEYEDFIKQVEYQSNMPLKLRNHYKNRPLTPNQCYEKLPDFLKNGG